MKGAGNALKVGFLVIGAIVLGYFTWKTVAERAAGTNAKTYWAHFKDAGGLYDKSRVVIAGLTIGEISSSTLDGRVAKVTVHIQNQIKLYTNAVLAKKATSLLGEYFLELDPGTAVSLAPDGSQVTNIELKSGDEITHVLEATTTDTLMHQVSETVPLVNETLTQIRDLTKEVRKLTTGPVANMADNLDKAVAADVAEVKAALDRANAILANLQNITGKGQGDILETIRNVKDASRGLKELLASSQGEVLTTGQKVRDSIDKLQNSVTQLEHTLTNTSQITDKINNGDGTVGKLVNDPQIADDIQNVTETASSFVGKIGGLQTAVGLTSEYNVLSQSLKTYLSIRLIPTADKYYLLEFIDDPRGARLHQVISTRSTDPRDPPSKVEEVVTVSSKFRFSFMFAKRLDWLTLRFGIKESTGGVGADFTLLNKRLELHADIFDTQANVYPRLKLEAALNFYQYLYIIAGLDDVLNGAIGSPAGGGRDYFFGAMLRFTDDDLKTLLTIGGSAIGNLTNN